MRALSEELQIVVQRDCLGGERIVEVLLPRPVDEAGYRRLGQLGAAVLFSALPRPFFRVEVAGAYQASGVLGERRVRFTVRVTARERASAIVQEACRRLASAA
jgi:hypothetical protein